VNKIVAMVVLLLILGAIAWWVLKDRHEEEAPYAEAMLAGMDKAGMRRVENDFRNLHTALTRYSAEQGAYPEKLGGALSSYMPRVPRRDPWGTGYRYSLQGSDDYRLESAGPDGKFGTSDDLLSESGSLISP
jgi:hypothetical protein